MVGTVSFCVLLLDQVDFLRLCEDNVTLNEEHDNVLSQTNKFLLLLLLLLVSLALTFTGSY
jgi:hypothetical protein